MKQAPYFDSTIEFDIDLVCRILSHLILLVLLYCFINSQLRTRSYAEILLEHSHLSILMISTTNKQLTLKLWFPSNATFVAYFSHQYWYRIPEGRYSYQTASISLLFSWYLPHCIDSREQNTSNRVLLRESWVIRIIVCSFLTTILYIVCIFLLVRKSLNVLWVTFC